MHSNQAEQLALNIQLRDDASFESFFPGTNAGLLHTLKQMSENKGERFVYLWGNSGVGRTHLLQATVQAAVRQGFTALYLPLQKFKESVNASAEIFQSVEKVNVVCLDDVECFLIKPHHEEMLFHFFNRIRSENNRLIVSLNHSPQGSSIKLPDLKSRLASGVVYHVQDLKDEEKIEALILRAERRGLELSTTVGQFLLSRCPRNMSILFSVLETLDRASLAEQRRLTLPFVKEVLGL